MDRKKTGPSEMRDKGDDRLPPPPLHTHTHTADRSRNKTFTFKLPSITRASLL